MTNRTPRARAGFTLAELLIVVAILGVLAAVAVPVFAGSLDKTKAQVCAANRAMLVRELLYSDMLEADKSGVIKDYEANDYALVSEKGYLCPSGEVLIPSYESITHIYSVKCPIHGGGPGDFDFASTVNGFLKDKGGLYQEILALTAKYGRTDLPRVDSNAPDGGYYSKPIKEWLEKATNYTLGGGMSTTWSFSSIETAGDTLGDYSIYWSRVNIEDCQPGNRILMMRYDSDTDTYSAGWSLVKSNKNDKGATYPSICQDADQKDFKSTVFVPVTGEGATSSGSFAAVYALYQQALVDSGGAGIQLKP